MCLIPLLHNVNKTQLSCFDNHAPNLYLTIIQMNKVTYLQQRKSLLFIQFKFPPLSPKCFIKFYFCNCNSDQMILSACTSVIIMELPFLYTVLKDSVYTTFPALRQCVQIQKELLFRVDFNQNSTYKFSSLTTISSALIKLKSLCICIIK